MPSYRKYSDEELQKFIKATHDALVAATQQVLNLKNGIGLPRDPAARKASLESFQKMKAKLQKDLDELYEALISPARE